MMNSYSSPINGPPPSDPRIGHDQSELGQWPAFEEFEQWWGKLRAVLELETGMDLNGTRDSRLRDAVRTVIRRNRIPFPLPTPGDREHAQLIEQITSELTIGESFFLRNENHMRALREHVFPQILKENQSRKELRFWSAGCATGEEAYSLAILIEDQLQGDHSWFISILGTDINHSFLERARKGIYRPWSFRQTQVHEDARFFRKNSGHYQVHERLRKHIRFTYLNLVKDVYPSALNGTLGLDLILFRNVAIYLKPEVTRSILDRFFQALRPGGWLLLGETEVALAPSLGFEVHRLPQATLFRKPVSTRDDPIRFYPASPVTILEKPSSSPIELHEPRNVPPVLDVLRTHADVDPSDNNLPAERDDSGAPEIHLLSSLDELKRQVQRNPDSRVRARLRLQLIHHLMEHAELKEARRELDICLREDPFLIEAYLLRASLEEEAGEFHEAERTYRRVLYLNWSAPLVHFHLGRILHQQGKMSQSRHCYDTALEIMDDFDPDALVEYGDGVCYGRLRELVALMLENDSE